MRRFWYTWSFLATAFAIVGTTNAQDMGNSAYRSYLSPASYGGSAIRKTQDQDVAPALDNGVAAQVGPVDMGQGIQSEGCGTTDCVDWQPAAAASGSNWMIGVSGLYFTRDHEDDVRITRNAAGDVLLSTSADINDMGGVETAITRRGCNGNGMQLVYWGLYPDESFQQIFGPGLSAYDTGFADVLINNGGGATDLLTLLDSNDEAYTYRTNEIHNVEFNLLRNVGSYTTRCGRNANFELLGGFRWFQFNENWGIGSVDTSFATNPVEYDVNVENSLFGFQLGGRSEYCITDRFSASIGMKVGFFNNHINHDQSIADSTGTLAYITAAGTDDYLYSSSKDDFSGLGELNLGMSYRLSCCSRLTFGYRVLGISGIALAPDQIPNDFTLANEINSINSNGDLILGGGYAGLEFCF